MKIDEKINSLLLIDNYKRLMFSYSDDYFVSNILYDDLIDYLNITKQKFVIFEYTFSFYSNVQISNIFALLNKNNIHYLIISNNADLILNVEHVIVFINNKIEIECNAKDIIKEEEKIRHFGFSLPFIMDLSLKLKAYGLINKIYTNFDKLVGDLWK